jgi:PAS domain S-box-containing protein
MHGAALETTHNATQNFRQALLQALPVGVCILDAMGRIVALNPEGERLLGWSETACVGLSLHDLIACVLEHTETLPAPCPITQTLQTDKPHWAAQSMLRCRDGNLRPVEYKCLPLAPSGGSGVLFCFRDLSTQLQLEKDLLRLIAFPEESPQPLIEFDANANLLYANAAMTTLMEAHGFSPMGYPSVLPPQVAQLVRQCMASGESLQGVEVAVGEQYFEWSFYATQQIGLVRGYGTDLTTRKQAEQELKCTRDAALETAQVKSNFLANVSHELRTPLNGIMGLTELTLLSELSAEQQEHLEMIRDSAGSLLALINRILDFSKIETGTLTLQPVHFQLRDTLQATLAPFERKARQKGLAFDYKVAAEVPEALVGDVAHLRKVLVQLLDNAIKFTEQGEVRVRLDLQPAPARGRSQPAQDGKAVVLHGTVMDTGIGITPAQQQRIFAPFMQADTSSTRQFGGTGLGLTLASRLVDLLGGKIWVESPGPGAGSCFHFTMPCGVYTAPSTPSAAASTQPTGQHSLRVLLAEDNIVNQKLTVRFLEKWGHRVTTASTGEAVLQAITEQPPFDLVLMDVEMPELDGLQATAAIREREHGRATHIPIIALTAHAMPGDRERCLAAGMDGYLTKPLYPETLLATITQLLAEAAPAAAVPCDMPLAKESFDQVALLVRLEGDHALLCELVTLFLDDAPQRLARLQEAMQAQEWQTVEQILHTLKGTAGNLCAYGTLKAAQRLEFLLQRAETAEASQAFTLLETEIKRLQNAFVAYTGTDGTPSPPSGT